MQPGVLLPDPVWNLSVCRLDGFADAHACREIAAEERERQPTTTRPKTMKRLVPPGFSGRTLPSPNLNPAHDCKNPKPKCQVKVEIILEG